VSRYVLFSDAVLFQFMTNSHGQVAPWRGSVSNANVGLAVAKYRLWGRVGQGKRGYGENVARQSCVIKAGLVMCKVGW
jgi:hypothetical protein